MLKKPTGLLKHTIFQVIKITWTQLLNLNYFLHRVLYRLNSSILWILKVHNDKCFLVDDVVCAQASANVSVMAMETRQSIALYQRRRETNQVAQSEKKVTSYENGKCSLTAKRWTGLFNIRHNHISIFIFILGIESNKDIEPIRKQQRRVVEKPTTHGKINVILRLLFFVFKWRDSILSHFKEFVSHLFIDEIAKSLSSTSNFAFDTLSNQM